jgi:hypothetical protein
MAAITSMLPTITTKDVTGGLNYAVENMSTLAISVASFVIVILVLVQMVSYGRMYKNVRRFFRTTVTFSASGNTLSNTRDPYAVVQKPSTASSRTTFTLSANGYFFAGANVKATVVSDGGGFVSVEKGTATTMTLTPYRIMAPIEVTAVTNAGGKITFVVPYGGQYFEAGDTFTTSDFATASPVSINNATLTVFSSTATSVTVTNTYTGATDTGFITHVFPKPIVSGVMDIFVTFPQLASK